MIGKTIPLVTAPVEGRSVGNVSALLAEISSLLEKHLQTGEAAAIDLKSLPFSPGEYDRLKGILGQGELVAKLEAIGPSEIVETRYPGVWWLTHRSVDGDIVAEVIEVTQCPDILKSQAPDMGAGLGRLHSLLYSDPPSD